MALVPISMLSKINDSIAAALKRKLDANGVRNDATTTDVGYVLDARMGKTLGDRAEKLELKVGDLYFDTDSSGRWGYKSSKNGAVTPFRNPTGNASAADVLSGKTFSSATAENAAGSMPNNGAWTGKTTGKGNVVIPAGYHNGNGYVSGEGAYNTGMSDADARVNENSASYKSGYTNGNSNGYSSGKADATIVSTSPIGSGPGTYTVEPGKLYIICSLNNNVNNRVDVSVSGATGIFSFVQQGGAFTTSTHIVRATSTTMTVSYNSTKHDGFTVARLNIG